MISHCEIQKTLNDVACDVGAAMDIRNNKWYDVLKLECCMDPLHRVTTHVWRPVDDAEQEGWAVLSKEYLDATPCFMS